MEERTEIGRVQEIHPVLPSLSPTAREATTSIHSLYLSARTGVYLLHSSLVKSSIFFLPLGAGHPDDMGIEAAAVSGPGKFRAAGRARLESINVAFALDSMFCVRPDSQQLDGPSICQSQPLLLDR